jgi:hypothetical protein
MVFLEIVDYFGIPFPIKETPGGEPAAGRGAYFAYDLDKHALGSAPIEFAVENLLPRPKIEFSLCNGDDDLATHDLALEVGVGVILAGAVVMAGGDGLVGREFFEPEIRELVQ